MHWFISAIIISRYPQCCIQMSINGTSTHTLRESGSIICTLCCEGCFHDMCPFFFFLLLHETHVTRPIFALLSQSDSGIASILFTSTPPLRAPCSMPIIIINNTNLLPHFHHPSTSLAMRIPCYHIEFDAIFMCYCSEMWPLSSVYSLYMWVPAVIVSFLLSASKQHTPISEARDSWVSAKHLWNDTWIGTYGQT